jgi:molecular chaperone GrpE
MAEDRPEALNPDELPSDVEHTELVAEPDTEADAEAVAQAESTGGDPLADALARIEVLQDQALRAQAEMENVRRRAARDVEHAHKYALEKFTADLLPVLDSLEKSVEIVEAAEDAGSDDGALVEGIELSLKLFLITCEKAGMAQVDPHGEPFDPQLHEAIAMVPNPDAEPNSVMEVMQKGYTLNGRLVRAAKVIVVKGED